MRWYLLHCRRFSNLLSVESQKLWFRSLDCAKLVRSEALNHRPKPYVKYLVIDWERNLYLSHKCCHCFESHVPVPPLQRSCLVAKEHKDTPSSWDQEECRSDCYLFQVLNLSLKLEFSSSQHYATKLEYDWQSRTPPTRFESKVECWTTIFSLRNQRLLWDLGKRIRCPRQTSNAPKLTTRVAHDETPYIFNHQIFNLHEYLFVIAPFNFLLNFLIDFVCACSQSLKLDSLIQLNFIRLCDNFISLNCQSESIDAYRLHDLNFKLNLLNSMHVLYFKLL